MRLPLLISTREWARHQRELRAALDRASRAEEQLAAERVAKDHLVLQLTSRWVTHQGGYGLDEVAAPSVATPPPNPRAFIREPNEFDMLKLEHYIKCAREADIPDPEADATRRWEAEMRGEQVMWSEGEQ